jgi:hypothetical protein
MSTENVYMEGDLRKQNPSALALRIGWALIDLGDVHEEGEHDKVQDLISL